MYSDYTFYKNVYHGEALSETEFSRYAPKASVKIDNATFGRIADSVLSPLETEAVKRCECECAELICAYEKTGGSSAASSAVQSEKVGEHQITYRNGTEITAAEKAFEAKIYGVIKEYLVNTGLMYRGEI